MERALQEGALSLAPHVVDLRPLVDQLTATYGTGPLQVGHRFVGTLQVDQQGGAGHHGVKQARIGLQGLSKEIKRSRNLAGPLVEHTLQVQKLRIAGVIGSALMPSRIAVSNSARASMASSSAAS